MKRIISLLLITLFLIFPLSVSAQEEIKVILDGNQVVFDQQPIMINSRTMVPVRAIYQALGAEVSWDGETRTASGTKNGITVSFKIDVPVVSINYNEKEIAAPAVIINNRTLVPVRALAEGFGVKVDWNGETHTVILTTNDTTTTISDYKTADGSSVVYTGQVSDGVPDGYGTGIFKDLDNVRFVGLWKDGVASAGRIYSSSNTAGYIGFITVTNQVISGYCEITLPSGQVYYGNWENDAMHGYGELYMPDGSYYKGQFQNNAIHGYGEMYDAVTNTVHKGTWAEGELIK